MEPRAVTLTRAMIAQAQGLFLFFFVPITLGGLLTPGYSAIRQQASEMTLVSNPLVVGLVNAGVILVGVSIIVFAIGMVRRFGMGVVLSSLLLAVFGVSMVANGIWKMGGPMHGLYGIGLFVVLAPLQLAYEMKGRKLTPDFFRFAIAVSLLWMTYMWASVAGMDPEGLRGLTQRVVAGVFLLWLGFVSRRVLQDDVQAGAADL